MELAGVVDLDELKRYLNAIRADVPLDDMDSAAHVRFMMFVRKIFTNPELMDAIHIYVEQE